MQLSLVVFDIDGTLVDSAALIVENFAAAFAAVGLAPPSRDAVLAQVGLSLPVAMEVLMPEAGAETRSAAVVGYRDSALRLRAARGAASVPLFDGAKATLEALAARPERLIGAATGMASPGLDHVLGVHDLHGLFVTRQTADLHPSKPHPAMLEAALRETGVAEERAVMVGDTTFDMQMAANASIAGIGVSWGHHGAEALRAAGARVVVDSFAALATAIDEIWEGTP